MAKHKLSFLKSRYFWLIAVVAVAILIALITLLANQIGIARKFAPIATLPLAAQYNLDLPGSGSTQSVYANLERAYLTLNANPKDIDAALARAKAYLSIKDTARAILSYQWVNKYFPENIAGWVGLADIYAAVGRMNDANAAYQTALQLEPDNADIQSKLDKLGGKS